MCTCGCALIFAIAVTFAFAAVYLGVVKRDGFALGTKVRFLSPQGNFLQSFKKLFSVRRAEIPAE